MFGYPHTSLGDRTWTSKALNYPHHGAACADFGRIIQVNAVEEHFMAKIYSRVGCSGAPAFDLNGSLLGILHGYSLDVTTFFSPAHVLHALKDQSLVGQKRYVYPAFTTWSNSLQNHYRATTSFNDNGNGADNDGIHNNMGSELDVMHTLTRGWS